MREIIFDTETTGLDPLEDRVIEIGGVELVNRFPSGRSIHFYIHPGSREIHPEAQAVHGISMADLAGKPAFAEIVGEFLAFIDGAITCNARTLIQARGIWSRLADPQGEARRVFKARFGGRDEA